MKKCLITGINGFIGSNLAKRLIEEGFEVHGLIRKTSDLKFLKDLDIKYHYGDITNFESLKEATIGCYRVFHVAALASDWGEYDTFYKINVEGTLNVAKACVENNVDRLVYISTVAMYGFGRLDVKESDEKVITGFPYNDTKKIAEEKLIEFSKETGLKCTIIKPGNVFGINDHTFIEKYLDAMHSNKIAFIDKGKRKTCPTYIENLIDAIIIASNKDEAINEDFIITDGLDITWKEFTDKFADELGLKRPKLSVPFKFAYIIGSILEFIYKSFKIKKAPLITRYRVSNGGLDYTFSIVKAKKILGYQPKVDFETSVKRTVDWYKNR